MNEIDMNKKPDDAGTYVSIGDSSSLVDQVSLKRVVENNQEPSSYNIESMPQPHAGISSSTLTPPSSPPPQPIDSISQTATNEATATALTTTNRDVSNANLILNDEQINNTSLLNKLSSDQTNQQQQELSRQSSSSTTTFSTKSRSSKLSGKITASSSGITPAHNQTTTANSALQPTTSTNLLSRPSLSLTGDSGVVKFNVTHQKSSAASSGGGSRSKKNKKKSSKRHTLESIDGSGLTTSYYNESSIGTSQHAQVPSSVYSQSTTVVNNTTTNSNLDHISVNGAAAVDMSATSQVVVLRDPVLIRGAGNITIFGICNKFSDSFPSALASKLAPEEYQDTMRQVNAILGDEVESSLKWLVLGSLFCCCTLGCSFLPVVYMNKRAKSHIEKLLEVENQRLYLRLGLRWRLSKTKYNSVNSLLEYVLVIDFLPNVLLYQPD